MVCGESATFVIGKWGDCMQLSGISDLHCSFWIYGGEIEWDQVLKRTFGPERKWKEGLHDLYLTPFLYYGEQLQVEEMGGPRNA